MTNRVRIEIVSPPTLYKDAVAGNILCRPGDPDSMFIKSGTRAVNLRTGVEDSFDQGAHVVILPPGSKITIEVL